MQSERQSNLVNTFTDEVNEVRLAAPFSNDNIFLIFRDNTF